MKSIQKLILLTLLALAHLSVKSQELTQQIDQVFSWVKPEGPGCVCALAKKGQVIFNKAYGMANMETNSPLTTNSMLDAGSMVKQFVAAATLLLVQEGKLSLSADIHQYLPELPNYGHEVTIDHLMTHTSGIRDWTGIRMLSSQDNDALTMVLRQSTLNFPPGQQWSYSNSGYVLLKEIVARASGKTFGEFVQESLFDKLGMQQTSYTASPENLTNRALAYEKRGDNWQLAVLEDNDRGGGGALMSTAGDLLIWNQALTEGKLGEWVTSKIQEPAKLSNGRVLSYARGLFVEDMEVGKLVWHGGSANGYKSVMGRLPKHDLSIAIMCNAGEAADARAAFAGRIFRLFVPEEEISEPEHLLTPSAELTLDQLKSKTGLFVNQSNSEIMQLITSNGRLVIAGGSLLTTIDENNFSNPQGDIEYMSSDEFKLHFLSNDQFEYISMEGDKSIFSRVSPSQLTDTALQTYEGEFKSDDMLSTFHVKSTSNGLVLYLDHAEFQKIPFQYITSDFFSFRRMEVKFVRDKEGRIVAFEYSNPILKKVRFTKVD
ncbi:MAG TPA: serine hydrolase domain-containing protein [Roseivirga sp.]